MTLNFWWVRHGPTHAKTLIGHTDHSVDLSDSAAIARLQAYLPNKATVFCSDLIRASQTARAIFGNPIAPIEQKSLREMNFGDWEDKKISDVSKSDPDLSRDFWQNPGQTAPPNGESWDVFSKRIHTEIDRITNQKTKNDIVIVAHFGVILAALQLAGGFKPKSVFSFKINNLSVTWLQYHPSSQAWTIQSVNQII